MIKRKLFTMKMQSSSLYIKLKYENDKEKFMFILFDQLLNKLAEFDIKNPEESKVLNLFEKLIDFFDYDIIKRIVNSPEYKNSLLGNIISYEDEVSDEDKKNSSIKLITETAQTLFNQIKIDLLTIIRDIDTEFSNHSDYFSESSESDKKII